ncbi:MAG: CHRD domain-containing protein [Bacteroidia bacterium]|nr:CHRD domain-containing protein [Bacteroidia bacterium]
MTYKHLPLILLLLMLGNLGFGQTTHTVNNQGLTFVPSSITIQQGDIVNWQIANNHNVVQVSQATWNANGTAPLTGGFNIPFGGGQFTFNTPGTFYYVCQPHAGLSMKGTVTVNAVSSNPDPSYVANLRGAQEFPSVVSPGFGQVELGLRDDTLFVSGEIESLSSPINTNIGIHIHDGLAGSNGPVVFPLTFTTTAGGTGAIISADDNKFELSQAQLENLNNRGFYVNVHTEKFGSGEIRGQIQPINGLTNLGENLYSTNLFGSNEVPSIMTTASGAIVFDMVGDTLTASGTFSGLSSMVNVALAGGAHIHLGFAGQNGGIELLLNIDLDADGLGGTFSADSNRFTLTAAQKSLLQTRSLYVNIHSLNFAGGELRGQIVKQPLSTFRAFLAGAQEVPSVLSGGQGNVLLELFPDSVVASGSFVGLGSDFNSNIGAHIHQAFAGRNGGVVFALSPDLDNDLRGGSFSSLNNTFATTPAQVSAMLNREFYVNVHTLGSPSGEVRGQLVAESNFFLYALLSGSQEVEPVYSLGTGAAIVEYHAGKATLSGTFNNMLSGFNEAIGGGAHIHEGFTGENGGVELLLKAELDAAETSGVFLADSNTFDISETFLDTLQGRQTYINIHSDNIPSGELRGQILGEAQNYFFSPLSGTSEPAPVNTEAFGGLAHEWLGGTLRSSGSFSNLSSELDVNIAGGAHIHVGLPGQNGPVQFLLNSFTFQGNTSGEFYADSNVFDVSGSLTTDTLLRRKLYVNIHSTNFGGGELRGQLLPPAQAYFTTSLAGKNETDPNNSTAIGAIKGELTRDSALVISGWFSGLDGDFDESIAGGAHIHAGAVGSNGGIELLLNSELVAGLKAGGFEADSNSFILSPAQVNKLIGDSLYVNIHTTTYGSGELRGQVLLETNSFPDSASQITAPSSSSTVFINGDGSTAFAATWDDSSDPDGNPLAYIWELSAAQDFSTTILKVNVGNATSFNSDFATIDSILNDAGVTVGDSILLYHRATVLDGAVCIIGEADSVFLKRGSLTSIEEIPVSDFSIYPNPTSSQFTLDIEDAEARSLSIYLFNAEGKQVWIQKADVFLGDYRTTVNISSFPTGIYQLLIIDNEGRSLNRKILKK